jgi:hypothetical protein
MLHSIVQALLPVAFIVLLGWASAALKVLKREHAGILAVLVTEWTQWTVIDSVYFTRSVHRLEHC